MNKKMSYYYKKGWIDSSRVFKGKSFKERVMMSLYILASTLGRACVFTRPIFSITDFNLAHMFSDSFNFSIEKSFEGATTKEKYWQLLAAYVINDLFMFLGLTIIISPIIVFWILYRFALNVDNDQGSLFIFGILISVIFGSLGIAFIVLKSLYSKPMAFIAKETEGFDSSDLMYNAKQGLQSSGKTVLFLINFTYTFYIFLYFLFGSCFILLLLLYGAVFGAVFGVLMGFALLMAGTYLIPNLSCARRCAEYALFKDIIPLQETVVVKPLEGNPDAFIPLFESTNKGNVSQDIDSKK